MRVSTPGYLPLPHWPPCRKEISSSSDNTTPVWSSLSAGPISLDPVTCYQTSFKSVSEKKFSVRNQCSLSVSWPEEADKPLGLTLLTSRDWGQQTLTLPPSCYQKHQAIAILLSCSILGRVLTYNPHYKSRGRNQIPKLSSTHSAQLYNVLCHTQRQPVRPALIQKIQYKLRRTVHATTVLKTGIILF